MIYLHQLTVILPCREGFIFMKFHETLHRDNQVKFGENKTLAKISEFTVYLLLIYENLDVLSYLSKNLIKFTGLCKM